MASSTGLLSNDNIKLGYKASSSAGSYTYIDDIQNIPDLGAAPEQVEVTTLSDTSRRYISGIKSVSALEFTVLYDATQFATINALSGSIDWVVEIDSSSFTFTGEPSCRLNGAGINEALTYTLTINVNSEIEFA